MAPERRERIEGWLLDENKGYREVRDLMAREWGVQTSHSAVWRYYTQRLVPRQLLEAKEAAVGITSRITSTSGKGEGPPSPRLRRGDDPFGEAALQRARMLGFMALMEPVPDGKAARVYLGIVDRIERRELARDRIELSERLVKLRERNETPPPKPKQTYEEKVEEMCGIFGVGTEVYYENERRQAEAFRARNAEGGTGKEETRKSEVGTRNGEGRETGDGGAQAGSSETAPLLQGTGDGRVAEAITSKITITNMTGGPAEVSFGRVLGAESGALHSASGRVAQAVLPSLGTGVQSGRSETAPLQEAPAAESRTESVRGVANWQGVGAGAPGSFHIGTAGHAVIFGGYGPGRNDERGNYWPRPEW